MATDKVVPLSGTIGVLSATDHDVQDLVRQAIEADEMDRQLTIGQALRKYKKAVFWAMFLSTSLIMEGYDVVIISSFYGQSQFQNRFGDLQPEGNKVITGKRIPCNFAIRARLTSPFSFMAVRAIQFVSCWSTGWLDYQRLRSRSIRLQENDDGLSRLDGMCDFHPVLFPFAPRSGIRRGHVWSK